MVVIGNVCGACCVGEGISLESCAVSLYVSLVLGEEGRGGAEGMEHLCLCLPSGIVTTSASYPRTKSIGP